MIAFSRFLETFWIGMAQHLWQTTLFLAVLAVLSWSLRRTSARLLSVLYWIGLLKLALPLPLLGPAVTKLLRAIAVAPPGNADVAVWTLTTRLFYPALVDGNAAGPSFWMIICLSLTSIWIGGTLFILLHRWRSGSSLRLLLQRRIEQEGASDPERLKALLPELGLPPGSVQLGRGFSVPFVVGALRPRIVIPERLVDALEPDDLRAVLLHEREHVRRREPLRYAVLAILLAVFWFYPLTWWLARRIRETAEMACDEAAIQRGLSAADYCRSLARTLRLGLTPQRSALAGVFGNRPSFLRTRLQRVRSGRRFAIMTSHRLAVGAALCAGLMISVLPLSPVGESRAAGASASGTLDELADADLPITMVYKQTAPEYLLSTLANISGLDIRIVGMVSRDPIDIELRDSTLAVALQRIAELCRLSYAVLGPNTLEVRGVMQAGKHEITYPVLIEEFKVQPLYPEQARLDKITGRVILEAIIFDDGTVGEMRALRVVPEGYTLFVDAAMDAVRGWHYEPAMQDGVPVSVYFTIVVEFQLK